MRTRDVVWSGDFFRWVTRLHFVLTIYLFPLRLVNLGGQV